MDPEMVGNYRSAHIPNSYKNGVADGVDEVVKSVRYQIKYGAKVIKAGATAGVLSHESTVGAQQYSFEELKAMVNEAARHGVYVSVHAHGTQGINDAIKAGVRSIEHGSLLSDESIRLMKEKGTYLVPTSYLGYAINYDMLPNDIRQKAEYVIPKARKSLEKAIQAHVKIVFGTDTPVFPHGDNAKEFSALVKRGMSPIDAIRTSTTNAAEMMDIKNRGQIKIGMLADIIGVEGDPMTNITVLEKVKFVMKTGRTYKDS
ncbi:amidohydrolase family protein [Legionella sp. W05-934-2]|uniref:metal-dependent hydrolase family protein n=1 Tax=Legionella sp. W05-934-2 TaxID=1198649 RepID=UPI0034621EB3